LIGKKNVNLIFNLVLKLLITVPLPELDFTEVQLELDFESQSLCFKGSKKIRKPGYLIIDQQNEKYTSTKFVEKAFQMQTIAAITVRYASRRISL